MDSTLKAQLAQPSLTDTERDALEGQLLPLLNHPKHRSEICLVLLETYFYHSSTWDSAAIQTYRQSYWKWLTYGMWQQLLQLPPDIAIRFFSLSIADALRQGIDVSGKLFSYLDRRFVEDSDLATFFSDVRSAMSTESLPISAAPTALTHHDIHTKLQWFERKEDDLGRAGFLASLKEMFWYGARPPEDIAPDAQIGRYFQLLQICFEPFDIVSAVENYIDLQHRFVADELTDEEKELLGIVDTEDHDVQSQIQHTEVSDASLVLSQAVAVPPDSYHTIQSHIITTYGDITTLPPTEITPVITYLSEQAEALQDPRINELIYFDTTENAFAWNDEVIKDTKIQNKK